MSYSFDEQTIKVISTAADARNARPKPAPKVAKSTTVEYS